MGKGVRTALPEEIARTFMSAASGIAVRQKTDGRASLVTATEDSETEWADHADRYAVIRDIGRGGMGRVEEVFDSTLGRSVARKVMLGELGENVAPLLIAEAQTSAQLEHPAIVPVYDLDADESGLPRYTMRYVQGRTLRDVLTDNQTEGRPHTPLAKLLGVLRQVCLAIDYAHSKGVIHRDLKPDNIMLGDFGEVYSLLDPDELEVLRRKARRPLPPEPTRRDVLLAIAALGGHLKHNGEPGWQTIGKGLEHLLAMVEGYRLVCPRSDQS